MRTLIYTGIFCQTEENRDLVKLWGKLVTHLNPGIDIIAFDSCSPFDPNLFLDSQIALHRFDDNPGHLAQGGKDGAGRTFCAGIAMADSRGYDYCVHLESDMFLARPIGPLVEKMAKSGVTAAACFLPQYQFFEFGICAMNVKRMIETSFIQRYDWQNAKLWPIPERRLPEVFGDDLWIIPWFGARLDQNQFNQYSIHNAYPYAPSDFLTHAGIEVVQRFLALNGIELTEAV